jgi:hypothetical protein
MRRSSQLFKQKREEELRHGRGRGGLGKGVSKRIMIIKV